MKASELQKHKEPWYKSLTLILFSGFVFFVADYMLKNEAIRKLSGRTVEYGPLKLQLFTNDQMAFSIPINQTVVIFMAILVLLVFLQYFTICVRDGLYANMWAANLVIWGAFSNLYDRLMRGFVVDYMAIGPSPVFNASDLAIIIGLIALMMLARNHERTLIVPIRETA